MKADCGTSAQTFLLIRVEVISLYFKLFNTATSERFDLYFEEILIV